MRVDAWAASAGTNGMITLDNAAFGPGLVVEVASATPATKPTPSSAYSDAGAGIRVAGYDTNYGTIKVEHDQSSNGGSFLGVTVAPGSQLNNLGTITANGQISNHSNETHLLFEGSGQSSGVLNNDGQVNLLADTVAFTGLAVTSSGTITLARPDGNLNANYPSLVMSGPVAASQTVELDAGQLVLSEAADQPLQFQATIAGWNTEGEGDPPLSAPQHLARLSAVLAGARRPGRHWQRDERRGN